MKEFYGTEMISKHADGFDIWNRTVNPPEYYAHCKTLIQALMIRDYGVANNWKPFPKSHTSETHEPYIHKRKRGYCIIKQINGKLTYFGIYDKIEDAIAERDLLIKYNWDWDNVCECSEEGDSWIDKVMKTSWRNCSKYDTFYNW